MARHESIITDSLLSNEDNAISFKARMAYHYIKRNYFNAKGDLHTAHNHAVKSVSLLEAKPEKISDEPKAYIIALHNLLIAQISLKKYTEFLYTHKKLRTLSFDSSLEQTELFITSSFLELAFYAATGEFKKGIVLVNEISKGLEQHKGKIHKVAEIVFFYSIFNIYFGAGDYSKSLQWLNKIINDTANTETIPDIYCFSRINNLIVHYELGNMDILEYIVKSTYRFLSQRNRLYKVENTILNFIRSKLPKVDTARKLIHAFKELKTELEEITKDDFEKKALEYFDFISWLESKIENRPFAEIVREKAKQLANVSI